LKSAATANLWLLPASKIDYDEIIREANSLAGKLSRAGLTQLGDRFLGKPTSAIRQLPDLLHRLAFRAQVVKRFAGKRPALEPAIATAQLVAYVKNATGR
jgi:hypothetical protein